MCVLTRVVGRRKRIAGMRHTPFDLAWLNRDRHACASALVAVLRGDRVPGLETCGDMRDDRQTVAVRVPATRRGSQRTRTEEMPRLLAEVSRARREAGTEDKRHDHDPVHRCTTPFRRFQGNSPHTTMRLAIRAREVLTGFSCGPMARRLRYVQFVTRRDAAGSGNWRVLPWAQER